MIRALGCDFGWLVDRVLDIFGLTIKELLTGGKHRKTLQKSRQPTNTPLFYLNKGQNRGLF
ncbi:hypothetical protein D1AOALGA4SA_12918 [Olavius algarvensis Delta 1 endosymbiont]|nr:hypothetical protein D1AOALGA4SA_12918 [Olavius algarvensis Delta 1 endosymbiont]